MADLDRVMQKKIIFGKTLGIELGGRIVFSGVAMVHSVATMVFRAL